MGLLMRFACAIFCCGLAFGQYTPPPGGGGGGAPSGPAGGSLAGTYPNPSLASPLVVIDQITPQGQWAIGNAAAFGDGLQFLYSQSLSDLTSFGGGMGNEFRLTYTGSAAADGLAVFGATANNAGGADVDNITAASFQSSSTGGTIQTMAGFVGGIALDAGTVVNGYGLYIYEPTVGLGSITNNYGIYIEDQPGWAIKTEAGKVEFGDVVNIGAFLQGTSAAPALTVTSCTGATIGTGSTNLAGFITGLPTGACTIVMTFASATAATDWSCQFTNRTTPANLFMQSNASASTTTATITGVGTSGDSLRYLCAAF